MDEEIVYSVLNITKVTVIKFSNLYDLGHEEAFNMIQSGILGQNEQLEQLGINMSEAKLEAFALSQGINKSYGEMSEAEKAALRYNYMLEETSNIQGSFAKNSGSLSEQFNIAKLNMNELSTQIGNILLPISESAMKKFNELGGALNDALKSEDVQSKIKDISDGIIELIEKVGDIALDGLPKLIELLKWIIDNSGIISAGIIGIGAAIKTIEVADKISDIASKFQALDIVGKVSDIAKKFKWLFLEIATGTPVMEALNIVFGLNSFGLIAAAIVGVIAALVYLWNTNEGFREAVIDCWNAIKEVGLGVWDWLVNFFTVDIPSTWNTLLEFFQGIPDWFAQLWDSVINTFLLWGENIWIFFSETIPMWISSITEWFNQLPYNIGYALGTVLGSIVQWVLDTWIYLVGNIPLWIQGISDWFAQLPGMIWIWLANVITGIYQWGSEVYNSAILWVSNAINGIISWFASLPGNIAAWLSTCIINIVSWGSDLYNNAINAARDTTNGIIEWFSSLPGKMVDIGSNIISGIWEGITSMGNWLWNKITGFAGGILDGFLNAFDINSPSRVMRDKVGKYIAQGIGVGFTDESENTESEVLGAVSNLTSNMRATVEFETSKTSLGMMSSLTSSGSNESTVDNNDSGIFIIKNYMDSDEISEYTYKKVDNQFALAGKRVR